MEQNSELFIGLDTSKLKISVAVAGGERTSEVRLFGEISSDQGIRDRRGHRCRVIDAFLCLSQNSHVLSGVDTYFHDRRFTGNIGNEAKFAPQRQFIASAVALDHTRRHQLLG